MASNTAKIGIMSFAHMHAASYAACLKKLPEVEFVGIADEEHDRAKRMARQLGVKAFPTYDDLLATDIDGIIVCSENANHRRHVALAAQAEKHVMCEKPLSINKEDADAIVEVCRRSGIKLMTAFPCRFHPAFEGMKSSLESGELGRPLGIKATNQGKCPGGWFIDTKLSGGGSVMDHTVHVIDLMRCMLRAEPVRVYAEIDNRMFGGDYDDTGVVSVDFSNGVFATIDCSWSRPKSAPFWGNVKLYVAGTKGCADMDMFAQKIDLISNKAGRMTYEYWGDDVDTAMVRSFAECIINDTKPVVTGEDGAKAVEVVAAAYESAKTGAPVDLES